jgi:hypothetical protein
LSRWLSFNFHNPFQLQGGTGNTGAGQEETNK